MNLEPWMYPAPDPRYAVSSEEMELLAQARRRWAAAVEQMIHDVRSDVTSPSSKPASTPSSTSLPKPSQTAADAFTSSTNTTPPTDTGIRGKTSMASKKLSFPDNGNVNFTLYDDGSVFIGGVGRALTPDNVDGLRELLGVKKPNYIIEEDSR